MPNQGTGGAVIAPDPPEPPGPSEHERTMDYGEPPPAKRLRDDDYVPSSSSEHPLPIPHEEQSASASAAPSSSPAAAPAEDSVPRAIVPSVEEYDLSLIHI